MRPNLTAPPPVVSPSSVVPGGLVYQIDKALWDWITGQTHVIPTPTPTPRALPMPAAIVEALNVERRKHGLSDLANDAPLDGVATYWSQSQALHGVMTHGPGASFATRIWSVHPGSRVGECVAEGATSIDGVVAMWMGSIPHRAIVLGNFTLAGAAAAYGRDGTLYWTFDAVRPA